MEKVSDYIMADYGLRKNAEGYPDPTAYEALMGMAKPGEIWAYKDKKVLIVKNHGKYCSTLMVGEYKHGSIEVTGGFVQPSMISYAFNDLLTFCDGKVTEDEFEEVMEEIGAALGIAICREVDGNQNADELNRMRKREKESADLLRIYEEQSKASLEEAVKCRNQLELLKGMYSELLEKFMQRV